MPPKIAHLVGLGAFGACAGFAALYAFVAYLAAPSATGGMMPVLSAVSWISLALVLFALVVVHVVLGRQLLHIGRGGGPRPV